MIFFFISWIINSVGLHFIKHKGRFVFSFECSVLTQQLLIWVLCDRLPYGMSGLMTHWSFFFFPLLFLKLFNFNSNVWLFQCSWLHYTLFKSVGIFLTGSILEALCDCPLNTGIMFNVANLDCCLMLMTAYQAIIKYVWGVTRHCVFMLLVEEMIW